MSPAGAAGRAGRVKLTCWGSSISAISFAAVTHCYDVDNFISVVYLVDSMTDPKLV
jgi:hypothetical protein